MSPAQKSAAGDDVVSKRGLAHFLDRERAGGRRQRAFAFGAEHDGIDLVLPTTLFDARYELDLDGTEVHLIYVGPCHQVGDTIIHVPKEGVVFAGEHRRALLESYRELTRTAPDELTTRFTAYNPAFDVTPAALLTAIVTDRRAIRLDRTLSGPIVLRTLREHPDLVRDILVTKSHSFMKGQALQQTKRILGEAP